MIKEGEIMAAKRTSKQNKIHEDSKGFTVFKYVLLILMAITILFPLLFVFMSSLKTDDEIFMNPFGLPLKAQFDHYKTVMIDMHMWRYMLNSLYYALASVLLTLVCSVMAGYAIARMKWKLSGTVMAILLTGFLIPMHAIILPLYLWVRKAHINSPWIVLVLIFTAFAIPKSTFIIANFLKGIPRSIEEAAVIDGANLGTVLVRIVTPLLAPAISVCVVFDFLTVWNDLLISLIFINDTAQRTLQLGIMMFKGDYSTNYGYLMTAVCCAIIPTITLYIFFQKRIVAGLTSGAVKG